MLKEYTVDDVPDYQGEYCIRTFEDGTQVGNSFRIGKEAVDIHTAELEEWGYVRNARRIYKPEQKETFVPKPWE